jgi:hypothetical protein
MGEVFWDLPYIYDRSIAVFAAVETQFVTTESPAGALESPAASNLVN